MGWISLGLGGAALLGFVGSLLKGTIGVGGGILKELTKDAGVLLSDLYQKGQQYLEEQEQRKIQEQMERDYQEHLQRRREYEREEYERNKGGLDAVQSKFNKLLNSDYYKTDFGYDCSEIAQDFYDAAGQKGKIYRIEGKNGYINGYEYNNQVEYIYHEVYSDGIYIYDPRYANVPVLKDDYFKALREINSDGFDVFEIMG